MGVIDQTSLDHGLFLPTFPLADSRWFWCPAGTFESLSGRSGRTLSAGRYEPWTHCSLAVALELYRSRFRDALFASDGNLCEVAAVEGLQVVDPIQSPVGMPHPVPLAEGSAGIRNRFVS
jgi:hypothetical protein